MPLVASLAVGGGPSGDFGRIRLALWREDLAEGDPEGRAEAAEASILVGEARDLDDLLRRRRRVRLPGLSPASVLGGTGVADLLLGIAVGAHRSRWGLAALTPAVGPLAAAVARESTQATSLAMCGRCHHSVCRPQLPAALPLSARRRAVVEGGMGGEPGARAAPFHTSKSTARRAMDPSKN